LTDAIFDAAGDLVVGTGADASARLAIGANTHVLTSNGTTATWAAPTGSGSGGLTQVTGTDAATAMAVGNNYVVDMSAWATADRVYSLPTTAAVGDQVGITITAGNATYELDMQTTAASNDTINGVDHDSTPWSRLFITGETVVFECVTANTAWVVVNDGRIPCKAKLEHATVQVIATSTTTPIEHDTETYDNAGIAAISTGSGVGGKITFRRAGKYQVEVYYHITGTTTAWLSSDKVDIRVFKNGSLETQYVNFVGGNSPSVVSRNGSATYDCAAGDYFEQYVVQTSGGNNSTAANGFDNAHIIAIEIF